MELGHRERFTYSQRAYYPEPLARCTTFRTPLYLTSTCHWAVRAGRCGGKRLRVILLFSFIIVHYIACIDRPRNNDMAPLNFQVLWNFLLVSLVVNIPWTVQIHHSKSCANQHPKISTFHLSNILCTVQYWESADWQR